MSLRIAIARGIVHVASWLVPSGRRSEWRAEWSGELAEVSRRSPGRRVVGFAIGSIPHAVAELRQDWNVEVLVYETRNAVRALVRHPTYSLTAALLVALGVGANTTVFTLVNAVLLRAPLGIEAPDRLVQVGRVGGTVGSDPLGFDNWSYPLYEDFRDKSRSFSGLAAYVTGDAVVGDADVQVATAQLVSTNYFGVLGATVSRGRTFVEDDGAPGAVPVAILNDALWRERFAADPNVVGKTLRVRGTPFRIVGVAPPEFTGAEVGAPRPDFWAPFVTTPLVFPGNDDRIDSRATSWIWIVGRLEPCVDAAAAEAELRTLYRSIQLELDGTVRERVAIAPGLGLRPEERALANTISAALFAMVTVVLLVACANLAALLLARGAARESEIGVRLAIGGSRARIVRHLLIETSIIALAGSATAFVLTRWTAQFVEWLMPYRLSVSFRPDARVLLFAVVMGVTTSVAFGVLPAIRTTRVDLLSLLRAGAVGVQSDRGRLRSALLVAQIALSFVLLGAAGLMTRSMQRANSTDPGFRTENMLIAELDLRTGDTASDDVLTRRLEQIAERAAFTPGVSSAALASSVPASGGMSSRSMWPADRRDPRSRPIVSMIVVDTGYFHTMDVPIVRGRQFDATRERAGMAVVVNETMARRFWPNGDAVGKEVGFGSLTGAKTAVVVGVARDTRNRSLRSMPSPQAYFLLSQNPTGSMLLHVRVAPGPTTVTSALSSDLRALLPGSPPLRFQSARSWLAIGYADVKLISILGGAFGALALALAAAGIYGVVSYETSRRRREYGVRLALGAKTSQVHAIVFARSARLSAIGIALGAAGFALAAPLLEQFMYGISTFDPLTLASITVVLLGAAGIAALGPAIRAARSDPIASLRAE